VPNLTSVARYSIDFRTVHYDDVVARRGAPNIDSRCTGTTMRDYMRASDLTHLPQEAIALYDDGTARGDRVLHFGETILQDTNAGGGKGWSRPKRGATKGIPAENGEKRESSEMVTLPRR
jgi:hypothetical protein